MKTAVFWNWVETARSVRCDPADTAELLGPVSVRAVRGFGRQLEAHVRALQTPAHLRALREVDEMVAAGAGADHVDYVCAAVVAAGEAAHSAVLGDATLLADQQWDDNLGADLLDLPEELADQVSEQPFDDTPSVPDLAVVFIRTIGRVEPPDMPIWRTTVNAAGDQTWESSEAWRSWWSPSGLEELDIDMEIEGPHGAKRGFKVKVGKRRCTVGFVRVCERGLNAAEQTAAAYADVRWVLEQVQVRFGLSRHPAFRV